MKFLWLPCLVWLLVACSGSSRAMLSPDGLALLEFKSNLTLDPTGFLNDWKDTDDTPCGWSGVTCGPNNSVVSELNLVGGQLEGSLSKSLGSLANLAALILSDNRLAGAIPEEIVNCKLLTRLDLSGNFLLNGSLPANMSQLRRLEHLDVSFNALGGPIPALGALTNLTYLGLEGNEFGGDISAIGLQRLTRLEFLRLIGNQFSGSLPNLSGHQNLQLLSFNGTLTAGGEVPDLSALQNLTYLAMSGAQLEAPLPTWIGNLPILGTLDLSNNELDGPIPVWIGPERQCWSGDVGAATCVTPQALFHLDLSHNSGVNLVNNSLELMLTNFSSLQELRLSNIGSAGRLLPPSVTTIARLRTIDPRLRVLDLSYSNLQGDLGLSILASAHVLFTQLQSLNLSGNRLTGQVPPGLALLPDIRVLDLSNNHLSGPLPPFPTHLQNATFFAGNPGLCGSPLEPCKPPSRKSIVLSLVLALVACLLLFAVSCILFAWRLRKSNLRQQQYAELIAAMQGKNSANLMPLAELRKATSNFSNESQIGVGGFGTVHKGKLNDGTTVAIKRSNRQGSQQDKDQFLNEVRILSHVNHRNLVRLLGCCLENKDALLVFEYVPSGTLQEHLRRKPSIPLTWEQRLRIAMQTADALAYLHCAANPPIFHRDVKSANILLDEDLNAKVADFGISKLVPLDATHVSTKAIMGTMGYIDPESYNSCKLSSKSDVYSFGVVLLELISAQAPLDLGRDPEEIALSTFAVSLICKGDLRDIVDPAIAHTFDSSDDGKDSIAGVAALAVQCLKPKSRDRPSMKEVSKDLQRLWLALDPTANFSTEDDSHEVSDDDGQEVSGVVHSEHVSLDGASLSEASLLASYKFGR